MAAVIEFPVSRIKQASQMGESQHAQVIIFPGERIERMDFALVDRRPARNGRAAINAAD